MGKYDNFKKWLKDQENSFATTIEALNEKTGIDFTKFNWSNGRSNNYASYWLESNYVVHTLDNKTLIFEYNENLATEIRNKNENKEKYQSTATSTAYACFKANEQDAFYKLMNFCPKYFKSAVEHFYTTTNPHETRYNSWVQCYNHFKHFKDLKKPLGPKSIDKASVRLGFYMASWGMYRGSSFLLQNDYTIYSEIIDKVLFNTDYNDLWELDKQIQGLIGSPIANVDGFIDNYANAIMDLVKAIRNEMQPYKEHYVHKSWYADHKNEVTADSVSKTLVTKLILGTIGCYPALDRYFSDAIGTVANDLSIDQIKCMLALAYYIKKELTEHTISITPNSDNSSNSNPALTLANYPVMKLIDMYYFTFGMEKPFLSLINNLLNKNPDIDKFIKDGESKDFKLLKQFIIWQKGKSPKYKIDISYPCPLFKENSKSTTCPCSYSNICSFANANSNGIKKIIKKLTDTKKELYKKICKIKD